MYLAVKAETSSDVVIQKVPQLVKVCSATHIEHLIKNALPGVQLKHLPEPTQRHSGKAEISVLQRQPVRSRMGGGDSRPQSRGLRARRPANPTMELLILLPQAS